MRKDANGEAPIRIVAYDPSWPRRFRDERAILERSLESWIAGPIEHVGSTAVPGLAAKPIIDIMVAVESLPASVPAVSALAEIGYVYFPYRPEVMHWFCKPSAATRTHHLHLVPAGSRLWKERIAFRDCLRRDLVTARDYAELKRRLARRYELDREAYTKAKGPFIRRVLSDVLPQGRPPGGRDRHVQGRGIGSWGPHGRR